MSDKGLYQKYQVIDRNTGQEVTGNHPPVTFTLVPERDRAAVEALRYYAELIDTPSGNKVLANDLRVWLDSIDPDPY